MFLKCRKLNILWLGIIHDWSKFLPDEFLPYARHFYGKYPKFAEIKHLPAIYTGLTQEDIAYQFDFGWLHHQHRNKHHWQRWLLTLDSARSDGKSFPLPMPDKYRREMLADWRGAGRAYGNSNTADWYTKNKAHIQLHPDTQQWIEAQLGLAERLL